MPEQYVIVDDDNELHITRDSFWSRLLHTFPRIKDNHVTIGDSIYVSDPSKTYRIGYKPWRFFKTQTFYRYLHFWRDGIANPIDLNARGEKDITGRVLSTASRSRKTEAILSKETNWLALLLIISVLSNIALVIAIITLSHGGK